MSQLDEAKNGEMWNRGHNVFWRRHKTERLPVINGPQELY